MGVQSLLHYIETVCPNACQLVDLLEISRGSISAAAKRARAAPSSGLCLVIDAETCLDRLYGGFYSDWVCGGQWNRMLQFLVNLVQVCKNAQLYLVVFFNGAVELQQLGEWAKTQVENRDKASKIFRHVHLKGTPPPKVWWLPPTCVRTCLRMAFRDLGVTVASSMDDHRQEVIAYLRENGFDGLLAQEADYAIFDPPRFFSAHCLKLKFSGNLMTKEFVMDEVAKQLDLHPNRFCVFGALLGNHILTEEDLREFFCQLLNKNPREWNIELHDKDIIPAVVQYVRRLDSVDDLEAVGRQVFSPTQTDLKNKMKRLQQSVQYYLNGTAEGFLKYLPKTHGVFPEQKSPSKDPGSYPAERPSEASKAYEEQLSEAESVYIQGESGYAMPQTPSIVIEPPSQVRIERPQKELKAEALHGKIKKIESEREEDPDKPSGSARPKLSDPHKLSSISSSSSSSNSSSPNRLSPEASLPGMKISSKLSGAAHKTSAEKLAEAGVGPLLVSPEIMRIASERHQKGLMSPFIYQVLTQGEVKIDVALEDERCKDLPPAVDFFRPIRQSMYGILFNSNAGQSKRVQREGSPEVVVKEWVVRPGCDMATPELVHGTTLDWSSQVPTVKRLWLGQLVEDKNRRLRAFLSCMGGDYSPLMLNTSYVPQHLLILCCVLRFMMMNKDSCLLRKHELDAFLAQSVSRHLHTYHLRQEIQLPSIQPRGMHLGTLFMSGVEAAIYANDVCGAPIPWSMCCPWRFFDGKVFHYKLIKASSGAPLVDICEGQVEMVMAVERMRQAIMEGVSFEFAKPTFGAGGPPSHGSGHYEYQPAGSSPHQTPPRSRPGFGRARGGGASPYDPRGGELQVAGVVVGSWAGGGQGRRGSPVGLTQPIPPSIGRAKRGGYGMQMPPMRGRGAPPPHFGHPMFMPHTPPGYMGRGRGVFRGTGPARYLGRPRSSSPRRGRGGGSSRGRGSTVEAPDGSGSIYVSQLSTEESYRDVEGDTSLTLEVHPGPSSGSDSSPHAGHSPDSGIHVPRTTPGDVD